MEVNRRTGPVGEGVSTTVRAPAVAPRIPDRSGPAPSRAGAAQRFGGGGWAREGVGGAMSAPSAPP